MRRKDTCPPGTFFSIAKTTQHFGVPRLFSLVDTNSYFFTFLRIVYFGIA